MQLKVKNSCELKRYVSQNISIVGQICADLGPNCSLSVKSTKFSGNIGKNMGINM